jgi:A/G-specific adenine glycosylase
MWQGLGYYSRARNLHACAKMIVETHGGIFPGTAAELVKLPGIGPYTAAAIASFAFAEPVATIDGNALRLFARLFGVENDIRKSSTINEIRALAQSQIPHDQPGEFNHAVMDFGSMVCKPNPDCTLCPLTHLCFAFNNTLTQKLPYKSKASKQRNRFFNYFVLTSDEMIAMKKRSTSDIWGNLYDLYLVETDQATAPHLVNDAFISTLSGLEMEVLYEAKHILSHQVIHAQFINIRMNNRALPENLDYYSLSEVLALPKPVLIDNFLSEHFKSSGQIDNFKY